jgi:hypothetical protein
MSALNPPTVIRPKGFGRKPNKYWTLHSGENNAFTLRMNEEMKTSIVGFKHRSDALFIGKMIETHYLRKKEWPDTSNGLVLPNMPAHLPDTLSHVLMFEWEFEELKVTCTRNILDMISVDGLIKTENGYTFEGNLYKFEGELEFYQERFEEFMIN